MHTAAGRMQTAWHQRLLEHLRAAPTCLLMPHCPRADAKNDDMAAARGWAAAAGSLRSGLHSPTAGGLYRRSRSLSGAQLLRCAQAIASLRAVAPHLNSLWAACLPGSLLPEDKSPG